MLVTAMVNSETAMIIAPLTVSLLTIDSQPLTISLTIAVSFVDRCPRHVLDAVSHTVLISAMITAGEVQQHGATSWVASGAMGGYTGYDGLRVG